MAKVDDLVRQRSARARQIFMAQAEAAARRIGYLVEHGKRDDMVKLRAAMYVMENILSVSDSAMFDGNEVVKTIAEEYNRMVKDGKNSQNKD